MIQEEAASALDLEDILSTSGGTAGGAETGRLSVRAEHQGIRPAGALAEVGGT